MINKKDKERIIEQISSSKDLNHFFAYLKTNSSKLFKIRKEIKENNGKLFFLRKRLLIKSINSDELKKEKNSVVILKGDVSLLSKYKRIFKYLGSFTHGNTINPSLINLINRVGVNNVKCILAIIIRRQLIRYIKLTRCSLQRFLRLLKKI